MRRLIKRLILWALADGVVVDEALSYDSVEITTLRSE